MTGSMMRTAALALVWGGLALLASGCCPEDGSTIVIGGDDGGPQDTAVVGAVIFSGGGGVLIDLSVIDPEEPGTTSSGEITAWSGSRDTSDSSDPLPGDSTPPTSTPIASTSLWNLKRSDGTHNAWAPGELSGTRDTADDQYWVYVQLKMRDSGGGSPVTLNYRQVWDPSVSEPDPKDFVKL